MKAREAQAGTGDLVDCGRFGSPPQQPKYCKAVVVEHFHRDVRRDLWGLRGPNGPGFFARRCLIKLESGAHQLEMLFCYFELFSCFRAVFSLSEMGSISEIRTIRRNHRGNYGNRTPRAKSWAGELGGKVDARPQGAITSSSSKTFLFFILATHISRMHCRWRCRGAAIRQLHRRILKKRGLVDGGVGFEPTLAPAMLIGPNFCLVRSVYQRLDAADVR